MSRRTALPVLLLTLLGALATPAGAAGTGHCVVHVDGTATAPVCFAEVGRALEHATGRQVPGGSSAASGWSADDVDAFIETANADRARARADRGLRRDRGVDTEVAPDGGGDVQLAMSAGTVIARVYDGSYLSGSSLTYSVSNWSGCSDGSRYGDSWLGSWNNRISSSRGYSGCDVIHYRYSGYSGTSRRCSSTCYTLGSLNNDTSSLRFVP